MDLFHFSPSLPFSLSDPTMNSYLLASLQELKARLQTDVFLQIQRNKKLKNELDQLQVQKQKESRKLSFGSQKLNDTQSMQKSEWEMSESSPQYLGFKKRNDTKNIPKNFGKAIITFIEQNEGVVKKCLIEEEGKEIGFEEFLFQVQRRKKDLNSIANLRDLWLEQKFIYAKTMRKLSLHFMKRGALRYVFRSRIVNHSGHIKYRKRILDVLRRPQEFTSVKTNY